MISRYEAYMDGTSLSSLDNSIYVLNIQPGEINKQITTNKVAGRVGSRIMKNEAVSTSVTVFFEIHEYDTVKRQAVCQKVQKWANGSVLTVSDRPDQRMRCVCSSYPHANAKEWTEPLSVTFVAYNPPYWEENNETSVTSTGTDQSVYVPGNASESLVSCTVTVGSSLSSITLAVGEKSITLNGLSAAANDEIEIGYNENNVMYITLNNSSILDKRTGASDDDLTAVCGEYNTFAVTTSASVSAVFKTRGCWY